MAKEGQRWAVISPMIGIALLLAAEPLLGQEWKAPIANQLWRVIVTKPLDRPRFAEALEEYCKQVLQAIPRNNPREEDWVKREMNKLRPIGEISEVFGSVQYSRFFFD